MKIYTRVVIMMKTLIFTMIYFLLAGTIFYLAFPRTNPLGEDNASAVVAMLIITTMLVSYRVYNHYTESLAKKVRKP